MKPDNLNIAILSVHSCPQGQLGGRDTGGMNVYIRELSAALSAIGHKIDIYTRAHDQRDARTEILPSGARLIHIRAGAVEDMGKLTQHAHLPEFIANLEEYRQNDGVNYDLISSHYWLSAKVGRTLAEKWNVPDVVMFHTTAVAKNGLGLATRQPGVRLESEKAIAQTACRIVTATSREKTFLAGAYDIPADKIEVIPCGVNTKLFAPVEKDTARKRLGIDPGKKMLLAVGRIEPLKGLDRLIRALRVLPEDINLMVLGGDDYGREEIERLRELGARFGLSRRVVFPGSVLQRELPLYYSAADVTVVPSFYETFGLVMVESLACGTPVAATNVGAAPIVIRPGFNGEIAQSNEPEHLAAAIAGALAIAANQKLLSDTVSSFSWSKVATSIEGLYNQITKNQDTVQTPLPVT